MERLAYINGGSIKGRHNVISSTGVEELSQKVNDIFLAGGKTIESPNVTESFKQVLEGVGDDTPVS